jgi:hypothetical protein
LEEITAERVAVVLAGDGSAEPNVHRLADHGHRQDLSRHGRKAGDA